MKEPKENKENKRAHDDAVETLEIELLLEGIYRHYGFDFREYARSSLRRRVREAVRAENLKTASELQKKVLRDPECMERFLLTLTVNVTAMFRDPAFFLAFRAKVVPWLKTYPFVRIWHVGCSTGEEVYSMAILLEEEEIYDRCRIYATDINEAVINKAKEGIFPLQMMKEYTENYLKAGGKRSFSNYYTAAYDNVIFRPSLKKNLVFAQHNLSTDASFNEFHCILCRNVMIYFRKPLQDRVHNLLFDSLVRFGTLMLGAKESIQFTPHEKDYEAVDATQKVYRRIR